MTAIVDVHHAGPVLVSLFKKAYPSLYATVKSMGRSTVGHDLGEGDWQHIAARITMEYGAEELSALEEESKVLFPALKRPDPDPYSPNKRPATMSDRFDKFGFFVAQEL